ncbi:MAG: ribosome maturation factor RimM [Pseudomonadota bacterium]
MSADKLVVGKLGGPHGVRGWIKVLSYTDPRENLFDYAPWQLERDGQWRHFEVEAGKPQGKGWIVKLVGVDDRNAAEALIHCRIAIEERQLPELDEGEYYWRDLIGLTVVTEGGQALGEVSGLMETGANDVLVVRGERQRLVPYIDPVVRSIDLERREIRVDWDPEF